MLMVKTVVVSAICLIGLVIIIGINTKFERAPVNLASTTKSTAPPPAVPRIAAPAPEMPAPAAPAPTASMAPTPAAPAPMAAIPASPPTEPSAAPPAQQAMATTQPAPQAQVSSRTGLPARLPNNAPSAPEAQAVPLNLSANQLAELQRALRERGFRAGPVDGIWGPRTADAVAEFKQVHGLEAHEPVDTVFLKHVQGQ